MLLEWRLAWRNVWRNPRRTGLTIAATVFAVVLVVFFVALTEGIHAKMIEDSVRVASGHVSIHGRDFLERRTLEHFVRFDAEIEAVVEREPGVVGLAPRIQGFGLLSGDSETKGVAVVGVDPEREPSVSSMAARVREGRFLSPQGSGRREIVVGSRLARTLEVGLGDEVLLYSFAYSLESAYELFRVVGIMRLPDARLDRTLAVISLADAQEFFVYGDRVTELAILFEDDDASLTALASLRGGLAGRTEIEVNGWRETMPDIVQILLLDSAGMYVMLAILVLVVGFGILNTILMMVLERKREFGVVLALGLRPFAVFRVVYAESLFLAIVGLAIGLVLALPLVLYCEANPIALSGGAADAMELFGIEPLITWKLEASNPVGSALTILVVALVAALYPALKASRAQPVDALRSL